MRQTCPCGLPQPYDACCGRYHSAWNAGQAAPTAELLMRSRYSAFAVGDETYLLETWHASTRPARLRLDPAQQWLELDVVRSSAGGMFDAEGTVEFRATFRLGRRQEVLHEISRFVREGGRWSYLGPVPLT